MRRWISPGCQEGLCTFDFRHVSVKLCPLSLCRLSGSILSEKRDREFVHDEEAVPYEDFKYPIISPPSKNDLLEMTRGLHPEQYNVLEDVVQLCKKISRSSKTDLRAVPAIRRIVHGGAGKLNDYYHFMYL